MPHKVLSRKALASLLLLLTIPILYGCATIVRGTSQEVRVTSDPADARILVNGEDRGATPTTLNLDRGRNYQIEFQKEGFSDQVVNVNQDFTVGWPIFGNIFSWGLIGIVVDVANGSAYKLQPEQVETALSSSPADAALPEESDVHITLLAKEDVDDAVDLSRATELEFSLSK